MFLLGSKIVIGGKTFGGVHQVTVKRSVYEPGATATIKVPVTAVLKQKDEPPTQVEVAQAIQIGDTVEISLGYNGALNLEFTGYVTQLNLQSPLEIVCEDEFYTTRHRNVTLQGKLTVAEILEQCGLQTGFAADLTIDNFAVPNKPVSAVLGKLKSELGLSVFFDLSGQVYACDAADVVKDTVKYVLRQNVIKDDDLQYQNTVTRVKVHAYSITRSGERIEYSAGEGGGSEKTLQYYDIEEVGQLAELAEAEYVRLINGAYSGKIETFLQPFAIPCMTAEITDDIYHERNGNYLIESTEVKYGTSGARRIVEIGQRL